MDGDGWRWMEMHGDTATAWVTAWVRVAAASHTWGCRRGRGEGKRRARDATVTYYGYTHAYYSYTYYGAREPKVDGRAHHRRPVHLVRVEVRVGVGVRGRVSGQGQA